MHTFIANQSKRFVVFRSTDELTMAALEASNIDYTPDENETLINPMAGVRPRNWSNAKSGWLEGGAVQTLKNADDLPSAIADLAENALNEFAREEGLALPPALAAGGVHGTVKQVGVGAFTEQALAEQADGKTVSEDDPDAPTPDDHDNWEDAGWDVVKMHDDGTVTTYQVKASTKKRSRWDKKEADYLIYAVMDDGELKKFRNLTKED